jgi:small redox-active disulfide protein 2
MIIKILGTGCKKCTKLAEVTEQAATQLALNFELKKVTDMEEIMSFSVMSTPALVVDDEVRFSGRVPTKEEVIEILQNTDATPSKNKCCKSTCCS